MSKPRTRPGHLSWRAESLLLWLLLTVDWGGTVEGGADDLAGAVGFSKRRDIYAAAQELVEAGWIEKEGGRAGLGGRFTLRDEPEKILIGLDGIQFHRKSLTEVNGIPKVRNTEPRIDDSFFSNRGAVKTTVVQDESAQAKPGVEATEHEKVYPEQAHLPVPGEGTGVYPQKAHPLYPQEAHVPAEGTPPVPGAGTPSRPKPLLTRIVEADRMPGGDDKLRGPFQDRRRAQVPLVQEAWALVFPNANPLTNANAKQMLALSDDYAEDLYEQLRDLAERKPQQPLSYVLAALRRNAATKHPGAALAQKEQGGMVQEYVLEKAPVSEDYRKQYEEAQRLAKEWGYAE